MKNVRFWFSFCNSGFVIVINKKSISFGYKIYESRLKSCTVRIKKSFSKFISIGRLTFIFNYFDESESS